MYAQEKRRKNSQYGSADIAGAWNGSTRRWNDRWGKIRPDTAGIDATITMFAAGLGAVGRGERVVADSMLAGIVKLRDEEKARRDTLKNPQPWDITWYGYVRARENILRGMILRSEGKRDQALALFLRAAAIDDSIPIEFGPPSTYKPPHEAAGEALLELKRFGDAEGEFKLALLRTPRRPAALMGLARALKGQGRTKEARVLFAELTQIWKRADPGVSDVEEARKNAASS